MRADTPTRRRKWFSLAQDTELWDDDVLWELPVNERKQVKNAMTWRRPLPPRLARVAVQHAPMMQTQAWYGYRMMVLGLVIGLLGSLITGLTSGFIGIAGLGAASAGLLWLLIGVIWLRAVAWSRRAARTGRWPERG
jgi:predicted lipid-binding transport protein (Tim44 family)